MVNQLIIQNGATHPYRAVLKEVPNENMIVD